MPASPEAEGRAVAQPGDGLQGWVWGRGAEEPLSVGWLRHARMAVIVHYAPGDRVSGSGDCGCRQDARFPGTAVLHHCSHALVPGSVGRWLF